MTTSLVVFPETAGLANETFADKVEHSIVTTSTKAGMRFPNGSFRDPVILLSMGSFTKP